ncbi:MAG: hypothetical protein M1822_003992 [Bathelium mastoideum]|nr:MAG: hypothetical protein M1822_003992 [Bathelium mastoideum]
MAPEFSSKSYWNTRFTTSPSAFDWLLPACSLDPLLRTTLASCPDPSPHILHIGCGSSWLAFHLRAHVSQPGQVLNVDFAEAAVELGRRKEAEMYPEDEGLSSGAEWRGEGAEEGERRMMRWEVAGLLDLASLVAAAGGSAAGPRFALVLDKSTSDAIACAESVPAADVFAGMDAMFSGSDAYGTVSSLRDRSVSDGSNTLDPMIVLSLHLATVVIEGGSWIAVSHSQERFWFLGSNSSAAARDPCRKLNSLDPKRFWNLERKEPLDAPEQTELSNDAVSQPKIKHWLYVIVRTSELLPPKRPRTWNEKS